MTDSIASCLGTPSDGVLEICTELLAESAGAATNAIVSPVAMHNVLTAFSACSTGNTKATLYAVLDKGDPEPYANIETEHLKSVSAIWCNPNCLSVGDADAFPGTIIRVPGDEAKATLDRWVEDASAGMIKEFPARISRDTILALVSVLRFEAPWACAFDPKRTVEASPFRNMDGTAGTVAMMEQTLFGLYTEDVNNTKYAAIPFDVGDIQAFAVFGMPEDPQSLGGAHDLEDMFAEAERLAGSDLPLHKVKVRIPRMSMETTEHGLDRFIPNVAPAHLGGLVTPEAMQPLVDMSMTSVFSADERGVRMASAASVCVSRGPAPPVPEFCASGPFFLSIVVDNIPLARACYVQAE